MGGCCPGLGGGGDGTSGTKPLNSLRNGLGEREEGISRVFAVNSLLFWHRKYKDANLLGGSGSEEEGEDLELSTVINTSASTEKESQEDSEEELNTGEIRRWVKLRGRGTNSHHLFLGVGC